MEDDVSNRRFTRRRRRAVAGRAGRPRRRRTSPATSRPGPGWAARGPAFSAVVGDAFPRFHLDEAQLGLVREALAGDVPTVLRRAWEDALDDRA